MFPTEGVAFCTASLYEPAAGPRAPESVPPGVATCEITLAGRDGRHSGRKVVTTKRSATATVAVCAKISQRRTMERTESTIRGAAWSRHHLRIPLRIEALAAEIVDFCGTAR